MDGLVQPEGSHTPMMVMPLIEVCHYLRSKINKVKEKVPDGLFPVKAILL